MTAPRPTLSLALAALTLAALPAVADGRGRDPDGSRMQARRVALGSTSNDTLRPPRDRADWRYFKLERARRVAISCRANAGARLVLTSATGSTLRQASGPNASVSLNLQPGVYYVAISASEATSYSLSIR